MSIKAKLINVMLRFTVKKQFADLSDIEKLRKGSGLAAEPPEEIETETVDAGGVNAEWVGWPGVDADKVVLYFHGGGYVFGGLDSHRDVAWRIAKETGVRVLLVDYRLAPENQFPAAVDDATAAYRWLLDQGFETDSIAVAGDSAGGGLSVSLMVSLKNLGLPLPKALVLMSPWADLSQSGESIRVNAKKDPMLGPETLQGFADLYLGDLDPTAVLASPLFADLSGLPPAKIIVGSTEVLLSDSERLAEKLKAAGNAVELDVWPNMAHVFPVFAGLIPEGKTALTQIGGFLAGHLESTPVQ